MNDSLCIHPIDRRIVVDILHTTLPPTAQVWVFGSRARGTEKRAADLDLAIDVGRVLTFSELQALDLAFEESELPYRVDIIDMQTIDGIFRQNVEKDRVLFS